jgi:cytochrome c biogenesis protein
MSQEVKNEKGLFDFLSSVKFALFLLTLIAISSVFGTLVKQRGSPEEYLELYSEKTYRLISFFGLDDVFHTKWFLILLLLFTLNLLLCGLKRLKRDISAAPKEVLIPPGDVMKRMGNAVYVPKKDIRSILEDLKFETKVIFHSPDSAYLEKGRISKYGVHFVHGSILVILFGSLLGLLFGFQGFIELKKGDVRSYITIRDKNPFKKDLPFAVRCRDFKIEFYPDGTPRDYASHVEILKNGEVILERKIRVNDPLKYGGLYFYQASYGKEGRFYFEIDGKKRILGEREVLREGDLAMRVLRYESSIHNFGPGVLVVYLNGQNPETTWFLKDVEKMAEKKLAGKIVRLKDIKEELYTVLEVRKDPGVHVVLLGFSLLLFGLFLNFFTSYKTLRLKKDEGGTWIIVSSSRGREESEREAEKIRRKFNVE